MHSSVILNSSIRRRNGKNNYLISSDSESELEFEINENSNFNTPRRVLRIHEENDFSDDDNSVINYSSRPSISLTTSVRKKTYFIETSNDSDKNTRLNEINKDIKEFDEFLTKTENFYTQPCIQTQSEFEPLDNSLFSNITCRRRNYTYNSDEENLSSIPRPSIKYQSSIKRKNNIKKIFTILDSETDEEISENLKNKRSSFCLGPELIKDDSSNNLENDSIWVSINSDFDLELKSSSFDSLQDLEWKTAFDSLSDLEKDQIFEKENNLFDNDDDYQIQNLNNKNLKSQNNQKIFTKKRDFLAKFWYKKFNINVFKNKLPEEVPIKWTGRLQRTAAQTLFITNNDGSKRVIIKLSKYVLDCEYRLKKTLLHECCHVAQFLLDSCIRPPHGQIFLKWGKLATKVYPELKVEIYHNYEIIYKFRYQCSNCLQIFGRQTKISDESKIACSICNSNVVFIGKGTINGNNIRNFHNIGKNDLNIVKTTKTNAYSEFVKKKFAEFKKEINEGRTPSRRAPSIMKEIAKLWNQKKNSDLIQEFENLSINN